MFARRPKSAQAVALRARIILACGEGLSNGAAASKVHVTGATVCKWRERFRVNRLEGLLDEPRPGAPRSISDAHKAVVTKTLESMPANSTHRSTRLMAQEGGAIAKRYRADLAGVRIAAAPSGEFQILERPAVRREGTGYRWALHESTTAGPCYA